MSTRRARSRQPDETLTAEFTSGQLIIGICAALFVALTCFLLGVVVGKVDPTASTGGEQLAQAAEPPRDGLSTEGVQTSQSTLVDRIKQQEAREVQVPPGNQGSDATRTPDGARVVSAPKPVNRNDALDSNPNNARAERTRPKPVTVRPASGSDPVDATAASPLPKPKPSDLPPPANMDKPAQDADEADKPTKVAVNIPLKELPTINSKPEASPASKPVEETKPEPEKPATSAAKPAETPAPNPPVVPAASAGDGKFGVQVASFLDSDRVKRATEYQRRLRENAGIEAKIFASDDGKAQKVIIVGYADKAAASKACAELRKKEAFKGAFVKALP